MNNEFKGSIPVALGAIKFNAAELLEIISILSRRRTVESKVICLRFLEWLELNPDLDADDICFLCALYCLLGEKKKAIDYFLRVCSETNVDKEVQNECLERFNSIQPLEFME